MFVEIRANLGVFFFFPAMYLVCFETVEWAASPRDLPVSASQVLDHYAPLIFIDVLVNFTC